MAGVWVCGLAEVALGLSVWWVEAGESKVLGSEAGAWGHLATEKMDPPLRQGEET